MQELYEQPFILLYLLRKCTGFIQWNFTKQYNIYLERHTIPWGKVEYKKSVRYFQIYFKFNSILIKISKEAFLFGAGSSMKLLKQDNLAIGVKKVKNCFIFWPRISLTRNLILKKNKRCTQRWIPKMFIT